MGGKTTLLDGLDARVLTRVAEEGYGPGAWHGPDLKAALSDIGSDLAFWRPAPGRHTIAEIALHHAYCLRSVRSQLTGRAPEPFPLEGEDWFPAPGPGALPWSEIQACLEGEQGQLMAAVADLEAGRAQTALSGTECFGLILGITCHAVYHAGQAQLIKRLRSA